MTKADEQQAGATGRIMLQNSLQQYTSYLVRKDDDGAVRYYLGDAARASDGWAALQKSMIPRVAWDSK